MQPSVIVSHKFRGIRCSGRDDSRGLQSRRGFRMQDCVVWHALSPRPVRSTAPVRVKVIDFLFA
jgi:hypothetical protein